MLIVWRWWYFTGIIGIGLTAFAAIETKHAARSSSTPVNVNVADLQAGRAPAQPFVALGEHVALTNLASSLGTQEEEQDRVDVLPDRGSGPPVHHGLARVGGTTPGSGSDPRE